MGNCNPKESDTENQANEKTGQSQNAYTLRSTPGNPSKMYPFTIVNGKPKELGSGAYSTVYEGVDKV